MENIRNIRNPRAGCALHGALAALQGIEGLVPIVHANAGCALQHTLAQGGGGYIDGFAVPAANIIDKQVIFGGGARLREQIKNTVKVVEGRLYVALGSCECAMVGDDLIGMAREAAEQGLPVAASNVAGFHGNLYRGYERAFLDLIDAIPELDLPPLVHAHVEGDARPQVNLFGVVPGANPFHKGDLFELRRILEGIGLRTNTFFGPGGSAALQALPEAALNLVFSRWGESIGNRLEEKYGTPQLVFDAAPLGFDEVELFVQAVVERLDGEALRAERFLEREKAWADYFLLGAAERYYADAAGLSAALVGDSETVLRIGGFLARFFAVDLKAAVLTDRLEDEPLPEGLAQQIVATNDAGDISEILLASGADLVFASSLESAAARELGVPLLPVSHPVRDRVIAHKTYAGLRGALGLVEDFLTLAGERGREIEGRMGRGIVGGM